MNKTNTENKIGNITENTIKGKKYIIKSVFVGEKDIKSVIWELAERKAIKEMGLDGAVL